MKITFKGDYALKIILDLSINYNRGLTSIKDISKRQDIPERFLEQIVTILKGASYVKTVRGPKGGIFLARDPSRITIGEIIRLVEGPTSPIACVCKTAHARCNFEKKCALREVFCLVRDKVNEVVDSTTFQEMVERTRELNDEMPLEYMI
jgi:Rrf2 family protein